MYYLLVPPYSHGFGGLVQEQEEEQAMYYQLLQNCLLNRYGGRRSDSFGGLALSKVQRHLQLQLLQRSKDTNPLADSCTQPRLLDFPVSELLCVKGLENYGYSENLIYCLVDRGTELTSVSGIELPPKDAGHALQFLEFCAAFREFTSKVHLHSPRVFNIHRKRKYGSAIVHSGVLAMEDQNKVAAMAAIPKKSNLRDSQEKQPASSTPSSSSPSLPTTATTTTHIQKPPAAKRSCWRFMEHFAGASWVS
ncbi:hypothetical protein RHSIM_Rhsim12G0086700 [Rhododendron simsii]|uniref:Uncharacterized protein n=1 Tax=Rhododendron simsii TaxID=118357 RepID=A0A834G223_RHOSS|nr:hypothetical protein RHSIM_Rhsim12G0086700 [Rhododendron simsii]